MRYCLGGIRSVILAIALTLAPDVCHAGTLKGRVLDEDTGKGLRRVTVRAYPHGRSVALVTATEGDGSFRFADLRPGSYAVCVPMDEEYRPVSVPAVEISEANETHLDLKVGRSLAIEGDSWVQAYPSFAQSFRATGLGLTMVRVKAFGPGRLVTVQTLDGDGPKGRPIGPPRTTEKVGGEGTSTVNWSGAEVPVTPGKRYTLRLSAPAGQKWVPGLAGLGDVYPLGSAYFAEIPRPASDLGIVICEDNGGLRTDYAASGSGRVHRALAVGQTFTALSREMTLASAVLSGLGELPAYVRFSIHKDAPGGEQIGPSKVVPAVEDAAVAWGPGEVPVTPGSHYYLHIESTSDMPFLCGFSADGYAGGLAVFDGRPAAEQDLAAIVVGMITEDDFERLHAHPERMEIVKLADPSFEQGGAAWKRDGEPGDAVGCDAGVIPPWGAKMFGWTKKKEGEASRTRIFQHVPVQKGSTYAFSGSVYTDHIGGRSSDVKVRLLVLPKGGDEVRNDALLDTSQWYATEGRWRRGTVEFIAQAETITLGFELEQRWALDSCSLYVDGAQLEKVRDHR